MFYRLSFTAGIGKPGEELQQFSKLNLPNWTGTGLGSISYQQRALISTARTGVSSASRKLHTSSISRNTACMVGPSHWLRWRFHEQRREQREWKKKKTLKLYCMDNIFLWVDWNKGTWRIEQNVSVKARDWKADQLTEHQFASLCVGFIPQVAKNILPSSIPAKG